MSKLRFDGSAYKNGKNKCTTCTYGIRSNEFRNYLEQCKFLPPTVHVAFSDSDIECTVTLNTSFWYHCPELKDEKIKEYLGKADFLKWKKGFPPKFYIYPTNFGCIIEKQ